MKTFKQFLEEARTHGYIRPNAPVYRVSNKLLFDSVLKDLHYLARGMLHEDHLDLWSSFHAVHDDYRDHYNGGYSVEFNRGDAPGGIIVYTQHPSECLNSILLPKLIPGFGVDNLR